MRAPHPIRKTPRCSVASPSACPIEATLCRCFRWHGEEVEALHHPTELDAGYVLGHPLEFLQVVFSGFAILLGPSFAVYARSGRTAAAQLSLAAATLNLATSWLVSPPSVPPSQTHRSSPLVACRSLDGQVVLALGGGLVSDTVRHPRRFDRPRSCVKPLLNHGLGVRCVECGSRCSRRATLLCGSV